MFKVQDNANKKTAVQTTVVAFRINFYRLYTLTNRHRKEGVFYAAKSRTSNNNTKRYFI
jgi:hypothetical protein